MLRPYKDAQQSPFFKNVWCARFALHTLRIKFFYLNAIESVSASYPPPIPHKVVARDGQTFGQLAQTWYGNSEYGGLIAENAGGISAVGQYGMQGGREIKLPQLINYKNNANTHESYQKFLSTMVDNLYPHLTTPIEEPDDSLNVVAIVVTVIATVVSFYVGGALGPVVAGAMNGAMGVTAGTTAAGITSGIAQGVITGLTNAAVQGVAKGAGLIQEVSWQQAASAGITAGLWASPLGAELGKTLDTLLKAEAIDPKVLGDAIMQSGKIAVAAEVLSMAAGKKEFDVANVLASMASTLTNTALAKVAPNELTKTTLSNLSTTAIDSVAHNNYQAESIAISLLGSAMQYGAQKGIEELSPHYQAALNGETVDQNNVARVNAENPGNRNPGNRLPGRNNPGNLPARPEQRRSSLPQNRNRSTIHFDDPGLDDDVMTKKLDVTIHSDDPRWQTIGSQPTPSASGNRSGFWRNPGMMERAVRSANTAKTENVAQFMEHVREELGPRRWIGSAIEHIGEKAGIVYPATRVNLSSAYAEGIRTYNQSAQMFFKYGNTEEFKQMGHQMERYFADLDREYLKSYGTKAVSYVGKTFNAYEWTAATTKVQAAWRTQGINEAGWVATHEYGGLVIGGIAGIGAVAALPEEAAGLAVIGAITSISARAVGGGVAEAGWKTAVDKVEDWWSKREEQSKKFKM